MDEKILKSERYFNEIFTMMRKATNVKLEPRNKTLNGTELRLLSEVIYASSKGERLISTQLAKRLNVTRSAISQIVNNLEKRGIVKRVADTVDKKIAYIELSNYAMDAFNDEKVIMVSYVGRIVEEFGEQKMDKLIELVDEFYEIAEKIRDLKE